MTKIIRISLIINILFVFVRCETPQSCFQQNYLHCITQYASCTKIQSSCAKACSSDSSCSFNCCHEGYCINKSAGSCMSNNNQTNSSSSSSTIVAIVVPIVLGVVICIACVCYQRRKRQQALLSIQQKAALNNINIQQNNQFNMSMANQNEQLMHMNQAMYQNNQQDYPLAQPIQPVQFGQVQPINQQYYNPNQQQIYAATQQQIFMASQPQQQIPGIYEAQLGNYPPQNQSIIGAPQYIQNPMTDNKQTTYI